MTALNKEKLAVNDAYSQISKKSSSTACAKGRAKTIGALDVLLDSTTARLHHAHHPAELFCRNLTAKSQSSSYRRTYVTDVRGSGMLHLPRTQIPTQ